MPMTNVVNENDRYIQRIFSRPQIKPSLFWCGVAPDFWRRINGFSSFDYGFSELRFVQIICIESHFGVICIVSVEYFSTILVMKLFVHCISSL